MYDAVNGKDVVAKIESLLEREMVAYKEERDAKLNSFINDHESELFDYVNNTEITITDSLLAKPFDQEYDDIHGTVEKLLSIKPIRIKDIVSGTPIFGREVPENRFPIQIFIEIEIGLLVKSFGGGLLDYVSRLVHARAVVAPAKVEEESPITLDEPQRYEWKETKTTIKRSLRIYATIDAAQFEKGILEDFRIEGIV
jgi:hypothetical protein